MFAVRHRLRGNRRWVTRALLLAGAVGLALALQAVYRNLSVPARLPVDEASWVWAPDANPWRGPEAFFLVRDFELTQVPNGAQLAILVDEEYVVFVNGRLVGSGRYRPGAPLDRYELGGILRSGINRITVEARSSRGVGGVVAQVGGEDAGGFRLGTDASWRVIRRFTPRLRDPGSPLPDQTAVVLGRPPYGRWGPFAAEPSEAPLDRRLAALPQALQPVRREVGHPDGEWRAVSQRRMRRVGLDTRVRFDFGRVLEGHVVLELEPGESDTGLLYFGYDQPQPAKRPADALVISVRRQRYWLTAEPRRFRYLSVLGLPGLRGVEGYPLDVESRRSTELVEPGASIAGVFGLRPPRLRTPPEEKLWRRLEGLPRGAGGEEG